MERGEKLNTVTHLLGALLALAGGGVLVSVGASSGDAWKIISFAIYAATLLLMYSLSTLYHGARQGRVKLILRILDYNSIYLLIAGCYTPLALVSLRGPWGWALLCGMWGLALFGIGQESWRRGKGRRFSSIAIYLLMGWSILVLAKPLIAALSWEGFSWLLASGIVYTTGTFFYLHDEKLPHGHGIWHLFVVAGSLLHYVMLIRYVA